MIDNVRSEKKKIRNMSNNIKEIIVSKFFLPHY